MQRNQQGFTLIELVIVIVILGILSAFALPRFADLGSDARQASIEGAAGAVRSAAAITRSAWLADGGEGDTVDLGDGSEEITVNSDNGFPVVGEEGIRRAAQLSDEDYHFEENDVLTVSIPDNGGARDECGFDYDPADGSVTFEGDAPGKGEC